MVAAAHAHTPYGRAWSATGRPLEPISQDHCAFYGDHAVFDDFTGAVYDTAESRRFATAIGRGKALILQNHGLLTVGQSVDEAAFWLHLLERCAQTMLLVGALAPRGGRPAYTVLSHEVASHTREQVGEPLHGWRGFQPLWDDLDRRAGGVPRVKAPSIDSIRAGDELPERSSARPASRTGTATPR